MRGLRAVLLSIALLWVAVPMAQARPGGVPEQGFRADMLDEFQLANLNLPPDMAGAFVSSVDFGSPAAHAGLRPNVFITAVNGVAVADVTSLVNRFQQVWSRDGEGLDLTLFDPARGVSDSITIRLPTLAAARTTSSLTVGANGDSMVVALPAAPQPPPAVAPKQSELAPYAAENAILYDGKSAPFVLLEFLCVVKDGTATADRSAGPHWHQVLRGNTYQRAGSGQIEYDTIGTGLHAGSSIPWSSNPPIYVYDIACRGGSADAAQLSVLMAAAVDAPVQPQLHDTPAFYYRDGALTAGKNSLPKGAGVGPALPMERFDHWDRDQSQFAFVVAGALPPVTPTAPVPMLITRLLSIAAPLSQVLVGLIFAAACIIIVASFKPLPSKSYLGVSLLFVVFIGLIFVLVPTGRASDPATLQAPIDAQMAAARAASNDVERLRAESAALIHRQGGLILPIPAAAMQHVRNNLDIHVIPPVALPLNPDIWLWFTLAPFAVLIGFAHRLVLGAAYFLTPHRATDVIQPLVNSGAAIYPSPDIAAALDTSIEDILSPPPLRRTWAMIARGKDLIERIKQDREISEAAAERDMARVQMLDARARIRQARSKLPWWRRWFT